MRRGTLITGSLALFLIPACVQHVPESNSSSPTVTPPAALARPPSDPPDKSPAAPLHVDSSIRDHDAGLAPPETQTAHPTVTFVAAGGYWESGSARGRYRVVVKTHCGEHCVEEVLLEQLEESPPDGTIRQVVVVPETAPMRVESVNFWPTGKWNGEVEFRLTDDQVKRRSRLCLKVTTSGGYEARSGPCQH